MKRPKILKNIKLEELIDLCESYINDCENGYVDDDYEHYIFETTMTTLYGKDVWNYVNEKIL